MPFVKVLKGCVASGAKISEGDTVEVSEKDSKILIENGMCEPAEKPVKKAPKKKKTVKDDS